MTDAESVFFKRREEENTKRNFYKSKKNSTGTGLTKKFLENLKPN